MKWKYVKINKDVSDTSIGYCYGRSNNYKKKNNDEIIKLAGFDLDQTLICPIGKNKFPKNSDDWKWLYCNIKQKLWSYYRLGYVITIITNQAGIKNSEEKLCIFKSKIEKIEKDILNDYPGFAFQIYCLNNQDVHRKPYPTILDDVKIDRNKSFYCGDAAGRDTDYSDSDIKFAYNVRINFKTPERLFLNDNKSHGILKYKIKPYDNDLLFRNDYQYTMKNNNTKKPELIIMVGLPGAGKSIITKNIAQWYNSNKTIIVTISLDILGSKSKMFNLIKKTACDGKNMIIDNTNLSKKIRNEIINTVSGINNKYFIRIMHINSSYDRSLHNNYYRYYKNYSHDPKFVPEFVYKIMLKNYDIPTTDENVDCIETIEPGVPFDVKYMMYFY